MATNDWLSPRRRASYRQNQTTTALRTRAGAYREPAPTSRQKLFAAQAVGAGRLTQHRYAGNGAPGPWRSNSSAARSASVACGHAETSVQPTTTARFGRANRLSPSSPLPISQALLRQTRGQLPSALVNSPMGRTEPAHRSAFRRTPSFHTLLRRSRLPPSARHPRDPPTR
jgi:hypothetical protein